MRTRSGKEDAYRWLQAAGQPNHEGYGVVGDGVFAPPPRPLVKVGGLIVISTDVLVPAIVALDTWFVELMQFYDGIKPSPINQFFLPLGASVIYGLAVTGEVGIGGNVFVKFGITGASPPALLNSGMWESPVQVVNTPPLDFSVTPSTAPGSGFFGFPIGVNSFNTDSFTPYSQLNFYVTNTHATNSTTEGRVRVVCWGIEA